MEKGAKIVVYIIGIALIFGIFVIIAHPDYRQTFISLTKGESLDTTIWQSNADYYTEITIESTKETIDAE